MKQLTLQIECQGLSRKLKQLEHEWIFKKLLMHAIDINILLLEVLNVV